MLEVRWSLQYDACVKCGLTKSRHHSHGLCHVCHGHSEHPEIIWSRWSDSCEGCGTSDRMIPYKKDGLCVNCYEPNKACKENTITSVVSKKNHRRCKLCFSTFAIGERVVDTISLADRIEVFHEKCWFKSFDAKFDTTAPLEQHEPAEMSEGTLK